jgi:myosin heavy subunit
MKNNIYTNVGDILISLNPFQVLPLYTQDMLTNYKVADDNLPPHIFALASSAYTGLLKNKTSQSCIISGESGAGKTEATKQILSFLAKASSANQGQGKLEQQVLKANPVMEAFGNAKTVHNNNSSRFGKLMRVQFRPEGSIVGAQIINYLLEKSRVCRQSVEERNYHIFYQLLAGVAEDPQLKKALGIEEVEDYFYLFQDENQAVAIDDVKDDALFEETWAAMEILQMGAEAQMSIFKTVAAILHLGNTEFEEDKRPDGTEASQVRFKDPVKKVAALLGLNSMKLELVSVWVHEAWAGKRMGA